MVTITEQANVKHCHSFEVNVRKACRSSRIVLLKPKSPGVLVKIQIQIQ